jgi:hypothetical protein
MRVSVGAMDDGQVLEILHSDVLEVVVYDVKLIRK